MSFLSQLKKQKESLKESETIVTRTDGTRYAETSDGNVPLPDNKYGFIVDTKPDDVPALLTEHLYIGSQDCTAANVLEKYSIKRVLSVGLDVDIKDVTHKYVQCLDLPKTDIKPVLNECLPFISEGIGSGENVLVHCNAGVSRTSMVAIAYLMKHRTMSYVDAHGLVKSVRPASRPNDGFVKQLKCLTFNT